MNKNHAGRSVQMLQPESCSATDLKETVELVLGEGTTGLLKLLKGVGGEDILERARVRVATTVKDEQKTGRARYHD